MPLMRLKSVRLVAAVVTVDIITARSTRSGRGRLRLIVISEPAASKRCLSSGFWMQMLHTVMFTMLEINGK